MRYSIDEVIINKVLAYLGERPFKEVAQMVQDMHSDAKPAPEMLTENTPTARVVKETEPITAEPETEVITTEPDNKEPDTDDKE